MPFRKGDLVKTWWDDGWHGTIMFGVVERAGPKMFLVRWESDLRNRLSQSEPRCELLRNDPDLLQEARAALGLGFFN